MTDKTQSTAKIILAKLKTTTEAKALREAHDTAAKVADPTTKPRRYAVNFRLDKTARSAKGDYAVRYAALNDLIKVLGAKPWHYATSSWEFSSYLMASTLKTRLSAPLDEKIDVLVITPIGASTVFGDPKKLQS